MTLLRGSEERLADQRLRALKLRMLRIPVLLQRRACPNHCLLEGLGQSVRRGKRLQQVVSQCTVEAAVNLRVGRSFTLASAGSKDHVQVFYHVLESVPLDVFFLSRT